MVSLEGSLSMLSLINLSPFLRHRVAVLPNVPTVNEVLKPDGIIVDFVPSSMRALITYADLEEKYPDRCAKLFDAYKKVLHDPEFIAKAKKQDIERRLARPGKVVGADQSRLRHFRPL